MVFSSSASNFVAGDMNGTGDIFVHDRQTNQTTLVSVSSGGAQGNDDSFDSAISGNGRYVTFASNADNLVAGDTNYDSDIFVHDRQTGQTTLVSANSGGAQGNNGSIDPAISADGRYVAFESSASNLVPEDVYIEWDIFVHDRQEGTTSRVSVSSVGVSYKHLTLPRSDLG